MIEPNADRRNKKTTNSILNDWYIPPSLALSLHWKSKNVIRTKCSKSLILCLLHFSVGLLVPHKVYDQWNWRENDTTITEHLNIQFYFVVIFSFLDAMSFEFSLPPINKLDSFYSVISIYEMASIKRRRRNRQKLNSAAAMNAKNRLVERCLRH